MASPFDHPYRGGFVGKEHRFALTVYFEDTDTAGIVYHANYLRFFERARSDMLRAAGIDQRQAIDQGLGAYAVSEMDIKWRKSAKLDDDLVRAKTYLETGHRSRDARRPASTVRNGAFTHR